MQRQLLKQCLSAAKPAWIEKTSSLAGMHVKTYGPVGFDRKVMHQLQMISQGRQEQRDIIDGIAQARKTLTIHYCKNIVAVHASSGNGWLPVDMQLAIFYNPAHQSEPLLFEHIKTGDRREIAIDWEEILIHELYHIWYFINKKAAIQNIKPATTAEERYKDPILLEGYAVRYVNNIRKLNGSNWIRLTHSTTGRDVMLDGPKQGQWLRLRAR